MNTLHRSLSLLLFTLSTGAAWAQLSGTMTVQRTVNVTPNTGSFTLVTAECPSGWSVLSGGADSAGSSDIELSVHAPTFGGARLINQPAATRDAASGWVVGVINYGTRSWPVTATVVCAQIAGVHVVIAHGDSTGATPNASGVGTIDSACPSGEVAVGGGVDVDDPAAMVITSSSPLDYANRIYLSDRPPGNNGASTGWSGYIVNQGMALRSLKVAAICVAPARLNNIVITVVSSGVAVAQGQHNGGAVTCPAGYVALGGGFDSRFVNLLVGTISTPLYPGKGNPRDRGPGTYTAPAGWFADTYSHASTAGARAMAIGVICAQQASVDAASAVTVYEFYNTNLKHYFRTSSASEAAGIDNGSAGAGWVRTGDNFTAHVAGTALAGNDVCRFYTSGANSHFYTAFADECSGLKGPNTGWTYEGLSFRIQLPATGSACPAGTVAVHRLYNNRFAFNDSNHRFTTFTAEIAALQAQGWQYEDVAFCSPNYSAG